MSLKYSGPAWNGSSSVSPNCSAGYLIPAPTRRIFGCLLNGGGVLSISPRLVLGGTKTNTILFTKQKSNHTFHFYVFYRVHQAFSYDAQSLDQALAAEPRVAP